jgi:hypothetical protein
MAQKNIISAETNPIEFLYPCIKMLNRQNNGYFHKISEKQRRTFKIVLPREELLGRNGQAMTTTKLAKVDKLDGLTVLSLDSQTWLEQLSFAIRNIEGFNGSTHKALELTYELKELVEHVEMIRKFNQERYEYARDELSREVSYLAIEKSKKSIEQAIGVKSK